MNTESTVIHQFGILVTEDSKPPLIIWPHDPVHESLGIVTIPFRKGDLD